MLIFQLQQEQTPWPNPQSLQDLLIPEELKTTALNENFMQFDSGAADASRFIVFATDEFLGYLANAEHLLSDATFKVFLGVLMFGNQLSLIQSCPVIFRQLFTIHILNFGRSFPAVFVLMSSQTQNDYLRVWRKVNELTMHSMQPQSMMSDFELANSSAFALEFPNAQKIVSYPV